MAPTLEVLAGLSGTGPEPVPFARPGQPTHSEGFVVRFSCTGSDAWIGNFQRGLSRFDRVLAHPNGVDALVVAGGQGYVVDVQARRCRHIFGAAILGAFIVGAPDLVVFDLQGTEFIAFDASGKRWQTRRLSFDGFRDVSVDAGEISGFAWHPEGTWHRFVVDVRTGESSGGALQ